MILKQMNKTEQEKSQNHYPEGPVLANSWSP